MRCSDRPLPARLCARSPSQERADVADPDRGAPPTPAILTRMEELGARVTHLYGLTETFGPIIVCDWHPEWDALVPSDEQNWAPVRAFPT